MTFCLHRLSLYTLEDLRNKIMAVISYSTTPKVSFIHSTSRNALFSMHFNMHLDCKLYNHTVCRANFFGCCTPLHLFYKFFVFNESALFHYTVLSCVTLHLISLNARLVGSQVYSVRLQSSNRCQWLLTSNWLQARENDVTFVSAASACT